MRTNLVILDQFPDKHLSCEASKIAGRLMLTVVFHGCLPSGWDTKTFYTNTGTQRQVHKDRRHLRSLLHKEQVLAQKKDKVGTQGLAQKREQVVERKEERGVG